VIHENTWELQPIATWKTCSCCRRPGPRIGKALMEWLRNAMRAEGWSRLYWVTAQDNRKPPLYDKFTQADGFVRYVLKQK